MHVSLMLFDSTRQHINNYNNSYFQTEVTLSKLKEGNNDAFFDDVLNNVDGSGYKYPLILEKPEILLFREIDWETSAGQSLALSVSRH